MKKLIFSLVSLFCISSVCFSYNYSGESFVIDYEQIRSLENDDHAEIENNVLVTTRNGETSRLKISKSSPVRISENSVRSAVKIPQVTTHDTVVDFFTRLALDEVQKNIRDDGTFAAGAKWPTAWTRDLSYSADLSLAFLFPEAVEKSLAGRVEDGVILQDTGSGGSWPVSTDRVVWAMAAYKYALYKQDPEYFNWVYDVILKTLNQDFFIAKENNHCYRGESTFLDWREQTYPRWCTNEFIAGSCALGTNAVYLLAFDAADKLAKITGKTPEEITRREDETDALKTGIREKFFLSDKGYFASLVLNDVYSYRYEGYDTLGSSLAVLSGLAPCEEYKSVLTCVEPGKFGMPVVAPQLANVPSYHNDAVWPFVQAYRILALKKAGLFKECEDEFASMIYAASMFQTFKENYVCSKFSEETQTNSDRQLWSCAGFLGCIYKVLCGIDFTENGLSINPLVFDSFREGVFLRNFRFGKNVLNLEISGNGDRIASYILNGQEVPAGYVIPYDSEESEFTVCIQLEKSEQYLSSYGENKNEFIFAAEDVSPAVPVINVEYEKNKAYVSWKSNWKNGFKVWGTKEFATFEKSLVLKSGNTVQYVSVSCIPQNHSLPVFSSKTVRIESPKNTWFVEAEDSVRSGGKVSSDESYDEETPSARISSDLEKVISNKGKYVENWGSEEGQFIEFEFNAKREGTYIVDFRFKNGHGPVNTGEKCAVACVVLNPSDSEAQSSVRYLPFPQQGSWSVWNFSSPVKFHLKKGKNKILLSTDNHCRTQHGQLNHISIDLMRISFEGK